MHTVAPPATCKHRAARTGQAHGPSARAKRIANLLKRLAEVKERLCVHFVSRRRSGAHYQQRPRDAGVLFELDCERACFRLHVPRAALDALEELAHEDRVLVLHEAER